MRYSSAVVLSTIAIGGAAAQPHGRHASFHARRQADVKPPPVEADWNAITYDLKNVDWSKINWSSVFASTPAATPTPTPEPKKQPTPTPEPKKEAPSSVPAPKPVESPKAPEPKPKPDSNSGKGDNVVSDLMVGVASITSKLGAKVGKNDKANNGGIWIGTDSAWQMEITNGGSQTNVFFCWKANGFSGMSINVNVPDISVGLKPGEKVNLSFAPNVPAACAPASESSKLALFGGLDTTWAEVTFGEWGAFDVSRNVNMKGTSISMQGSKCTSDMETCVFKCKNPDATTCEKGVDYDLFNCSAGNGGGGGYDPIMAGTGGGCSMGSTGEKIKVTFS